MGSVKIFRSESSLRLQSRQKREPVNDRDLIQPIGQPETEGNVPDFEQLNR